MAWVSTEPAGRLPTADWTLLSSLIERGLPAVFACLLFSVVVLFSFISIFVSVCLISYFMFEKMSAQSDAVLIDLSGSSTTKRVAKESECEPAKKRPRELEILFDDLSSYYSADDFEVRRRPPAGTYTETTQSMGHNNTQVSERPRRNRPPIGTYCEDKLTKIQEKGTKDRQRDKEKEKKIIGVVDIKKEVETIGGSEKNGQEITETIDLTLEDDKEESNIIDLSVAPYSNMNKCALEASGRSAKTKAEEKPKTKSGVGACKVCGQIGYTETKKEELNIEEKDKKSEVQLFRIVRPPCQHHCAMCGFWHLQVHQVTKHINQSHPFRCENGHFKAFDTTEEKQIHMVVEHGQKYHGCATCGTSYLTEKRYQIHTLSQGHRTGVQIQFDTVRRVKKMLGLRKEVELRGETNLDRNGKLFKNIPANLVKNYKLRDYMYMHDMPIVVNLRNQLQKKKDKMNAAQVAPKEASPTVLNASLIFDNIMTAMSPNSKKKTMEIIEDKQPSEEDASQSGPSVPQDVIVLSDTEKEQFPQPFNEPIPVQQQHVSHSSSASVSNDFTENELQEFESEWLIDFNPEEQQNTGQTTATETEEFGWDWDLDYHMSFDNNNNKKNHFT